MRYTHPIAVRLEFYIASGNCKSEIRLQITLGGKPEKGNGAHKEYQECSEKWVSAGALCQGVWLPPRGDKISVA